MELCTGLQRQQTHMAAKIKAQDLEISGLKERVKFLEDKDRGSAEPSQEDAPIKGGSMEIAEEVRVERSTELGRNDTEEMVNLLSSMEAANILTSRVAAVSVSPVAGVSTVGVPTVSGLFLTVSAIFTTASMSKPLSKNEQREFNMSFLKSHDGWKTKHFRGMTLEEIKEKFIPVWKQLEDFVPISSKEECERIKRKRLKLDQGSAKREDLHQLWTLVKETLSIKQATIDKEKELWVELKRLFEPNFEDQLWTHNQAFIHDPLE
nr:hypothetical protein [Tanacetum cinerariifolium]